MNDPVLESLNRASAEYTSEDIDNVVAYLRRTRQNYESGVKPKKEGAVTAKEIMDKLGVSSLSAPEGFVRRI